MKPFDEKFADNVRDAFDNFQTEMPKEEWQKMQQKLKASRKTRIIPLFPAKRWAAALTGMVVLATTAIFLETRYELLTNQPITEAATEQKEDATNDINQPSQNQTQPLYDEQDNIENGKENPEELSSPSLPEPEPIQNHKDSNERSSVAVRSDDRNSSFSSAQQPSEMMADAAGEESIINDTTRNDDTFEKQQIAETMKQTEKANNNTPDLLTTEIHSHIHQPENGTAIKKADPADPFSNYLPHMERKNRPGWQVAAASMRPFATRHPGKGFGFSAGMVNEWALSESVSLQAGGLLAYNQLSYDPMSNRTLSGASDEAYFDTSGNNGTEDYIYNTASQNDYEILAIDIPLNIKFNIQENRRTQWYFSTGVSSLLFLQQRFTENQTYLASSTEFNNSSGMTERIYTSYSNSTEEEMDPFQTFNFARLANISVGYAIRRENDFLIIEPFVKLPLGGITHRGLSMGMGGITLKYGFGKQ